jgi:pimeloyl-ACP methyl ester carboxylesterase
MGLFGKLFGIESASDKATPTPAPADPTPEVPLENSRWHVIDKQSRLCIVFVHGLLSSSTSCWTSQDSVFFPDLVKQDPELNGISIFLGGFYSTIDSGEYGIPNCCDELFAALRRPAEAGRAVMEFDHVLFVCHSLGGVIVRRLLEEHADAFTGKTVGLLLLASPTGGSSYADWAQPLAALYGNKIVEQLRPTNDMLQDVDRRFRKMLEAGRIPNLVGAEASEHKATVRAKYLPPIARLVVVPGSAATYFGDTQVIPDSDHSTIAKPTNRAHPTYLFFKSFFSQRFMPLVDANLGLQKREQLVPLAARVLFDVYSRDSKDFYLERNVDRQIAETLQLNSVWLHGASGTGKTTLAKRYLDHYEMSAIEVSLAHLTENFTPGEVIAEVLATCNAAIEGPSPTVAQAVRVLAERARQSRVPLVFDEVPLHRINEQSQRSLLALLSNLVEGMKKQGAAAAVLVCSIGGPSSACKNEKIVEQIEFIEVLPWTSYEIGKLAQLLTAALPDIRASDHIIEKVVSRCDGAPRFLKSFLRRRVRMITSGESEEESFRRTLDAFART